MGMTRRRIRMAGVARSIAIASLLALGAAGCTGGAAATPGLQGSPAPSAPASAAPQDPSAGATPMPHLSPVPDITAKPGISQAPGLPGSPGPVDSDDVPPDVIQAAVDDAAARAGVDPSAATVVTAQSVTWPNGALGCPVRGFLYTQAITPGYRVVVEAGGQRYDYRATQQGDLRWCENPPGPG